MSKKTIIFSEEILKTIIFWKEILKIAIFWIITPEILFLFGIYFVQFSLKLGGKAFLVVPWILKKIV